MFSLIPPQYKVAAIAIAILVASAALWSFGLWQHHQGVLDGRAEVKAAWSAAVKKQQADALAEAAKNARETQRRLKEQQDAQAAYDQSLAQARADADAAASSEQRLRAQLARYAVAARRRPGDPAPVVNGQTALASPGVLSELLGRADARAGLLASVADAARRAGIQCEREYDALIQH